MTAETFLDTTLVEGDKGPDWKENVESYEVDFGTENIRVTLQLTENGDVAIRTLKLPLLIWIHFYGTRRIIATFQEVPNGKEL